LVRALTSWQWKLRSGARGGGDGGDGGGEDVQFLIRFHHSIDGTYSCPVVCGSCRTGNAPLQVYDGGDGDWKILVSNPRLRVQPLTDGGGDDVQRDFVDHHA
jgi:hypothetical protein